ncbi:DUF3987 domain-containing protein [Nocardioides psychrotolerans]|uniref:DUF3987 domain-containing protein n=1 Tax=Nocardioides psychrotolerans TaxID=1005945 RepID=UPI0031383905
MTAIGTAAGPTRTAPPTSISLQTSSPARAEYELLGQLRLARCLTNSSGGPVLDPAALHGLAGRIVRKLEPLTEASAPAMLVTILTAFATMVGRGAFVRVGSERHYPIIFAVVIGSSAKARKGTSLAAVRPVLEAGDDPTLAFMQSRLRKGFQSGEALIQAAADLSAGRAENDDNIPDQRLLVLETEFAKTLTVAQRQGSILSMVLRSAWDGEPLENRTRREDLVASAAHLGVIAHVTAPELDRKLDLVEVANGFANRFLHVWSAPHLAIATPGRLQSSVVAELGGDLQLATTFAGTVGEMTRTAAFENEWNSLYYVLRLQPSGGDVFDSLTARAAPHILRLAMVYALLDQSTELDVTHLRAASALWEYCEATVAHVWGATLGSEQLDKLYAAALKAGTSGLSRTDIIGLFSNNLAKQEVDDLVTRLVGMGLARAESQSTGGRPRQVLLATDI